MERYFIGVDGGGTRTTAIIINGKGDQIAFAQGKGINFNAIGMGCAREILFRLVTELLGKAGIQRYEMLSIGMSALDGAASAELLKEFCGDLFDPALVVMHSDIHMALYGFTQGGAGMLLISGTGMMAAGHNEKGESYISGGLGYLLGDEGSSFCIGQDGIRAAINASDGIGVSTVLTELLLSHYGLDTARDLLAELYKSPVPNEYVASFTVAVIEAFHRGDRAAVDIIHRAMDTLVRHTKTMLRNFSSDTVRIGCVGGLFEKNSDIFTIFEKKIMADYPFACISIPTLLPCVGAILFGLRANAVSHAGEITKMIISHTNRNCSVS